MRSENILLVIERARYSKDLSFIDKLVETVGDGYEVVWYERRRLSYFKKVDPNGKLGRYPGWVREPLKTLMVIFSPGLWASYLNFYELRERWIWGKCINLRKYIGQLSANHNVVVLSRSIGGRLASRVAGQAGVKKLICLGYPFKHPQKRDEPKRYRHLPEMKTPFLIIQGERDEYGGREAIAKRYPLSASTSVLFLDTDHNFCLSPADWDKMINAILQFTKD